MGSTSEPRTRRGLPLPPPPSRFLKGVPGATEAAGPGPGGSLRAASTSKPSAHGKHAWAEAGPPKRHSPRSPNATVESWGGRRGTELRTSPAGPGARPRWGGEGGTEAESLQAYHAHQSPVEPGWRWLKPPAAIAPVWLENPERMAA